MPLVKAKSDVKKRLKQQQDKEMFVSDEAQYKLAAILADAPSIESFAGTEWEMKPLRFGTQYLMVQEICKINQAESATYGDVLKEIMVQIPSLCKVLTLALLNDRKKIFENGDPDAGYSELFNNTYNTILWEAENSDLAKIILDCLSMIDVSFFMEALGMLRIFRASVTEKKRTRTKKAGQK